MFACTKCRVVKSDENFSFRSLKRGVRLRICKECTRKQVNQHYVDHRDRYLEKTATRNKVIRAQIREHIWDYLLKHPCVDCGEKDPIVLEFDHFENKIIHVSHMAQMNSSLDKVNEEMAKCLVRCANCHRRKTSYERGWYKK